VTGASKRGYSREFTPKTERRVRFEVDRIPPTLWSRVRVKAKRDGVSIRALVLGLLRDWADGNEDALRDAFAAGWAKALTAQQFGNLEAFERIKAAYLGSKDRRR